MKDSALRDAYRERYASCHGKYALTVPFMERFFELASVEGPDGATAAGFVGKITGNTFMKREFGAQLVEEFLPTVDLQTVIDTSGAYIPGHGTPTVILFGRSAAAGRGHAARRRWHPRRAEPAGRPGAGPGVDVDRDARRPTREQDRFVRSSDVDGASSARPSDDPRYRPRAAATQLEAASRDACRCVSCDRASCRHRRGRRVRTDRGSRVESRDRVRSRRWSRATACATGSRPRRIGGAVARTTSRAQPADAGRGVSVVRSGRGERSSSAGRRSAKTERRDGGSTWCEYQDALRRHLGPRSRSPGARWRRTTTSCSTAAGRCSTDRAGDQAAGGGERGASTSRCSGCSTARWRASG